MPIEPHADETNKDQSDSDGRVASDPDRWRRKELRLREREIINNEKLTERELDLREKEAAKSAWRNPVFVAIIAAAVAAGGNAGITYLNGMLQRNLERDRAASEIELEKEKANLQEEIERNKADAARILGVIKTGDPQSAKKNLSFLLDAGLITDKFTANRLTAFLETAPSANLPSLPVVQSGGLRPESQLHVLAIGIDHYNEEHAKQLRLKFAAADAKDVAWTLLNTQGSLYARVNVQVLRDEEATKAGIFRALDTIEKTMQKVDVAVIDFSGESALIDGSPYLLPYDVDARDPVSVKASAVGVSELAKELGALAERGRVLVLLDACHSGATTVAGANVTVDAILLRAALATNNVTVLTSSSGSEAALEDPKWGHGALTKVFLDALGSAADTNHNGVISMSELVSYVEAGVPRLTNGRQTPGVDMRFESTLFAVAPQSGVSAAQ